MPVPRIDLAAQMGTVCGKTFSSGHKYLPSSRFLCPKSQLSLRWVPPPAKPSAMVTNICSPATFCAQNHSSCQNGYRLQPNLLLWSQITADILLTGTVQIFIHLVAFRNNMLICCAKYGILSRVKKVPDVTRLSKRRIPSE